MRKSVLLLLITTLSLCTLMAQQEAIRFTVQVSTDSLLMDNPLQVSFSLENAKGQDFEAPYFTGFSVLSGPNVSTSMTVVNGRTTQSVRYTYLLQPEEVGNYYIEPASIRVDGEVFETSPVEILVVPNPDGIRQSPNSPMGGPFFQFEQRMPEGFPFNMEEFGFDQDFFNFPGFDFNWEDMPRLEDMPGFRDMPMPEAPEQPQKKKRKTYKL